MFSGMRFLCGSADFRRFPRILKIQKKKNLECIKTAVLIPEIPKVPTVGRGASPLPHPPPARSLRSLAKLFSSLFFKYFLFSCLIPVFCIHAQYALQGVSNRAVNQTWLRKLWRKFVWTFILIYKPVAAEPGEGGGGGSCSPLNLANSKKKYIYISLYNMSANTL